MKRLLAFLIAFIIITLNIPAKASGIELYYDGEYHTYKGSIFSLYVNEEKLTPPMEPIVFNNRALVPLREVFEALGADVHYNNATKEIIITGEDTTVKLQIGNNNAYINGERKAIPDGVVPKLITKVGVATKTMVPVRFVSESIGLTVDFEDETGSIKITGEIKKEEEEKLIIKKPSITKTRDVVTTIKLTLNGQYKKEIKPSLTSSEVLYFDLENTEYEGASKTQVNHGAVISLRLGLHEDYTRVAVDMKNHLKYSVSISADKKIITITVTAKEPLEEENPDDIGNSSPPKEDEPSKEEPPKDSEDENPDDTVTLPEEEEPTVTVNVEALKKYTPSKGVKYVIIDAGHGGSDPGALGNIEEEKYKEKDINLAVAKLVEKNLTDRGVKVIMTRSDDTFPTLTERPRLANQKDAAMFVSIHVNSAANAPKASGIEVYYSNKNNHDFYGVTSKELANSVLKALISETKAENRGVKTENHAVTRLSVMPAILIELGFISNEEEIKLLIDEEYQKTLADAITEGILAELGDIKVPERRDLVEKLVAEQIGEDKAKEYMDEVWK